MNTLNSIQQYRLTVKALTLTIGKKKSTTHPSEVFCFLPTRGKHICKAAESQPANQSYAKELTLAHSKLDPFQHAVS